MISDAPPVAAKKPVATPASTPAATILALAVIAAGVAVGREALLAFGAIHGTRWIGPYARRIDGLTAQSWMLPAGIAVALVGLALIAVAVKPRRRTHVALTGAGAWLRRRDIGSVAAAAAVGTPGVKSTKVSGSPRRVRVTVVPAAGTPAADLAVAVRAAVTEALSPLVKPPKVIVRAQQPRTP